MNPETAAGGLEPGRGKVVGGRGAAVDRLGRPVGGGACRGRCVWHCGTAWSVFECGSNASLSMRSVARRSLVEVWVVRTPASPSVLSRGTSDEEGDCEAADRAADRAARIATSRRWVRRLRSACKAESVRTASWVRSMDAASERVGAAVLVEVGYCVCAPASGTARSWIMCPDVKDKGCKR